MVSGRFLREALALVLLLLAIVSVIALFAPDAGAIVPALARAALDPARLGDRLCRTAAGRLRGHAVDEDDAGRALDGRVRCRACGARPARDVPSRRRRRRRCRGRRPGWGSHRPRGFDHPDRCGGHRRGVGRARPPGRGRPAALLQHDDRRSRGAPTLRGGRAHRAPERGGPQGRRAPPARERDPRSRGRGRAGGRTARPHRPHARPARGGWRRRGRAAGHRASRAAGTGLDERCRRAGDPPLATDEIATSPRRGARADRGRAPGRGGRRYGATRPSRPSSDHGSCPASSCSPTPRSPAQPRWTSPPRASASARRWRTSASA